jgi:signal transduction histidine kinase/ActR/RegA family two-component response regulator
MRIRSHLLLLASVVLVPGLLAGLMAVEQVRQSEREAALRELRESVRATALLVDGQVQRSLGALQALGGSPSLARGDWVSLDEEARRIDRPPDLWTLVLDESGTQRINTALPFGSAPPPPAARSRVASVLASGQPLVTGVFTGPATGRLLTTVYAPAKPGASGRYVVAQSFSLDFWKGVMDYPESRRDWIVAVIDQQGRFVSRSHLARELVGKQARPELVAAAASAPDGLIRHATVEGVDVYDAFSHSALTGWTIAVAAPRQSIEAAATRAAVWLGLGVVTALALAVLLASILSRTLMQAMAAASAAAGEIGRGRQPAPLCTALGEVNALGVAFTDAGRLLTDERQARATAEAERAALLANEIAARALAQHENAAKDQFIALLAHELRTPLAAVAGATELLLRAEGDRASRARLLAIVQRQNQHLKRIVDDLLDMSRMLSGKISLDRRPVDLGVAAARSVDVQQATDPALRQRLRLKTEPGLWIHADPVRIEQIVNNLIGNALKFSDPAGAVQVDVQTTPDGAALLRVVDHGAGIPAAMIERIFEPFVQAPGLAGQHASGLGIGLALVRQLVALHGGTVTARSDGPGRGSSFSVTLPRTAPPAAGDAVQSQVPERELAQTQPPRLVDTPSTTAADPAPCRVLLVEDDVDARETMAELLRDHGYAVAEAGDGLSALAAVQAAPPDVVVMDMGLPGMTGPELAAAIAALPALRGLPLIALSGYGRAPGADAPGVPVFAAHLTKPVDSAVLAAAIEAHGLHRRHRPV